MDLNCVLAIKFKDFILVAADGSLLQNVIIARTDDVKIHKVSSKIVLAATGEPGEAQRFADYITRNVQLYKFRNKYEMGVNEVSHFTRRILADSIRAEPCFVKLLLAGYDDKDGPQLYFMDYLGSMVNLGYVAHGYGGMMSLSIMDRYFLPNMDQDQGYDLLKKCVKEIHIRFIVNLPNFIVQRVDKTGISDLPPINLESFQNVNK